MRQKPIGYTAIALWGIGGTDTIIKPILFPRQSYDLRIITSAAIALTIVWALGGVAIAIQRLAETLVNISRSEQYRASYLRGQVDILTRDEAPYNGRRHNGRRHNGRNSITTL